MAVSFEIDSSAEVGVEQTVDPADLANGLPIPKETIVAVNVAVDSLDEINITVNGIDKSVLLRWEQDCEETIKQHAISINQTKDMMIDLDKQISHAAELLKSLKDQKKGSVERLIQLETRGPELPPKPKPPKIAGEGREENLSSTPASVDDSNTDQSWRLIPTDKVLEGVERLSEKKQELIIDQFPTLGDLQDARVEAAKEWLHFSKKLPKGIGETMADRIAERVLDEVGRYSPDLVEPKQVAAAPATPASSNSDSDSSSEIEYEDFEDSLADV